MRFSSLLLVNFSWLVGGYHFEDPYADHTNMAIHFDREGRMMDSLRAFTAAAEFSPSVSSFINLGVCQMRLASASTDRSEKIRRYHHSFHSMTRGSKIMASLDDQQLYEENWKALMKNFQIEKIPFPEDNSQEVDDEPQMCGAIVEDHLVEEEDSLFEVADHRRDFLIHQRPVIRAKTLPRISVGELDKRKEFRRYALRAEPFILTGAMEGWKCVNNNTGEDGTWRWLEKLTSKWEGSVVDFYPHNMLSKARQSPYLTRLQRAISEIKLLSGDPKSKFRMESQKGALNPGRYFHLQLGPKEWAELEESGDLPRERHWHLNNDRWMDECGLSQSNEALRREYHLKTHWKIILVGARGAGMFNHSDTFQTSSWHAHLSGSKWWYVCGTLTTGQTECFEDILRPGEILYYGKGWSHETQNLETPTVTITDTAIHAHNFRAVIGQLHSECARDSLNFKFSAALCDALDTCFVTLHDLFDSKETTNSKPPPPWRSIATPALIQKREAISPIENNYDGRNYITE